MHRTRLSLDNPAFAGRLRYEHRSPAYVKRPVRYSSTGLIQDVTPIHIHAATVAKPMPKPHHAVKPASSVHARPKVPPHERSDFQRSSAYRPAKKHRRHGRQTLFLYAMAAVLFVVGVAVSLNGLRANHQVAAQVKQLQQTGPSDGDSSGKQPRVPSTKKLSPKAIASYAVAPNLPRYIDIPKLNVHARILSEGVDSQGALEVPWNIYDTGWYNASAQPGQPGAMLVDGHSGVGIQHGIFHDLPTLKKGDSIVITRGDGQKFTYRVISAKAVSADRVDMSSMMVSADTGKPGLNLITCAGDIIPGTLELNQRMLVRAVM